MTLAMRKGVFVEYTDSEGPDQPPNPRSQGFRYPPHYENTPMQIYWEVYNPKKENIQIKNLIFFKCVLKNIVGTRSASVRLFLRVSTIYVFSKIRKTNV